MLTDSSGLIKKAFTLFGFVLPAILLISFYIVGELKIQAHLRQKRLYSLKFKAYQPLIYMPGHIMLYIGQYQNEPIVFHNVWSLNTCRSAGNRICISYALNSTLKPGQEQFVKNSHTGLLG